MTMPTESHIARAIEELTTERAMLQARIGKIDAALAHMRELFHLPGPKPRRAPTPASSGNGHANGNGHSTLSVEAIRSALQNGPLSPGDLSAALGVERAKLRLALKQYETAGVIVSTGATGNRRVALAAGAPAKEAP
jgi:hypothetical protein